MNCCALCKQPLYYYISCELQVQSALYRVTFLTLKRWKDSFGKKGINDNAVKTKVTVGVHSILRGLPGGHELSVIKDFSCNLIEPSHS